MSDTLYITTKGGKRYRRDRASSRINANEVQDMYAYNILHGRNPTDQIEKGIRDTYLELRCAENKANGTLQDQNPGDPALALHLTVGGKEAVSIGDA